MKSKNDKAVAKFIAAVAEPTRIAVIRQLVGGTKTVGELAKAIGVEIVNISHHLGVMRQAGLVTSEKDGRFVRYTQTCVTGGDDQEIELADTVSGVKVSIPA